MDQPTDWSTDKAGYRVAKHMTRNIDLQNLALMKDLL